MSLEDMPACKDPRCRHPARHHGDRAVAPCAPLAPARFHEQPNGMFITVYNANPGPRCQCRGYRSG